MRVNSVKYLSDDDKEIPIKGLEELVDETKKYLSDAEKNKKRHFLSIQKVKIQERKQAMIEECKTIYPCCIRRCRSGWSYPHTL